MCATVTAIVQSQCHLAVNHGGVVVAGVSGVWLAATHIGIQPVRFESASVRVTLSSSSCIVLLIYHTGSVAFSAEFF